MLLFISELQAMGCVIHALSLLVNYRRWVVLSMLLFISELQAMGCVCFGFSKFDAFIGLGSIMTCVST